MPDTSQRSTDGARIFNRPVDRAREAHGAIRIVPMRKFWTPLFGYLPETYVETREAVKEQALRDEYERAIARNRKPEPDDEK
jgi:hypothetical protein